MTPSPTAAHYDRWMLDRQAEYHACCQRTGVHRFDCSTGARREQPVRRSR